jgi:hypothetical protein
VERDTERRRLQDELNERQARFEKAQSAVREQQSHLEQLCQEAGDQSPEGLLTAWERSERKRQLLETSHRLRSQLRELSGATPLEAFMAEARSS